MSNFTKSDLVNAIAETTAKSRREVDEIISAALQIIKEETAGGRSVNLNGFGKFAVKERAARMGRNPATGEPIQIAASRSLNFKPSKAA